jgi:hypothetical protein
MDLDDGWLFTCDGALAMADAISPGPCSPHHGDTPSRAGFPPDLAGFHRQRHGGAKLHGREACGGAF